MKSYKDEFLRWAEEKKVEIFDKLSDVMPDCKYDLKKGQTCTFRNYCFIDFPGYTIMGFCKSEYGSCVYLDYDCYWAPAHPKNILLDGTSDQQCNVEISCDKKYYILTINRVRCVLQCYYKDEYANISPIQDGLEAFEETLGNVRVDFIKHEITTEGKRTPKWVNFTRTIDIAVLKQALDTHIKTYTFDIDSKKISVFVPEVIHYFHNNTLTEKDIEEYAAKYTAQMKSYRDCDAWLGKELIQRLLAEERLMKNGEADSFKLKLHFDWYVTIKKEITGYTNYSVNAYCLDNAQSFNRRYDTLSKALLHCLNAFNENVVTTNKYKSIEDYLLQPNR
ncbi:hypothetical protein IR083_07750 [Dysgonomonas sp. GY75]|uniref:hypothetical protein n=1 Tax=Dysgonomonas sp. GY75 TaxID=2780419 RepID=UPI001884452F|nr:hypothetical protein [Dysgonomonas sp. GY75]MBF0648711.1 hypothetical protein [Dysgonomonas sp. GY75]